MALEQTFFQIFTLIQFFLTAFFLMKLFRLARQKKKITERTYWILVKAVIAAALLLSFIVPAGFHLLFDQF